MRTRALAAAACLLALTACGSITPSLRGAHAVTSSHPAPAPSSSAVSPRAATNVLVPPPLPRVGQPIIGRVRVVAYYGAAGTGALGVLGAGTPEHAAQAILRRAAGYRAYGKPVQPAMELLATVAQGSPGRDANYSNPVSTAQITRYLDVAHAHRMLLILDLQPGRAAFLEQAKALRPILLDPSVSLALDPEWKVGRGQQPGGGRIGSSSAAGVNAVGAWLSRLVRANHLPDKLLVVHQFTLSMLPDREHLVARAGIEMVLHADGFGRPRTKIAVLHQLAFPHPPFGVGFKLFLTEDSRLMSPREVMRLHPQPDVITYQ